MTTPMNHLYDHTLEHLKHLIAFDTTSCNSNMALIYYIENYLKQQDIETFLDFDASGQKANLLASIGPAYKKGGVILSGHTDVVPIDNQSWDVPPFELTVKDTRLYGRGSTDMKSFIAICLAMVPVFREYQLTVPIHLIFSYDEEVGCQGVPSMVDHVARNLPRPALAIIGEPTSMQLITSHKGISSFRTIITGVEAHSSCPHLGVNAIEIAASLIQSLQQLIQTLPHQNPDFVPAGCTLNIAKIHGGTAINIIPNQCIIEWEIRTLPDVMVNSITDSFSAICHDLASHYHQNHTTVSIHTEQVHQSPALQHKTEETAIHTLLKLLGSNQTGAVSFATEAGIFQSAHIHAVVCGPGSIEQAHKPNEFIESSQVKQCIDFLQQLSTYLAANPML